MRAASGAERKHVTLPTDFRSPRENGHSRHGQLTARFAPKQSSSMTRRMPQLGGLPTFRNQFANRWIAVSRASRRVQIGFTLSHFRSRASLGQNGQLLNSDLQKFIT
jgi:hypothetical protein